MLKYINSSSDRNKKKWRIIVNKRNASSDAKAKMQKGHERKKERKKKILFYGKKVHRTVLYIKCQINIITYYFIQRKTD